MPAQCRTNGANWEVLDLNKAGFRQPKEPEPFAARRAAALLGVLGG